MELRPFKDEEIEVVNDFDALTAPGGSRVRVLHHDAPTKLRTTPQGLVHGVNLFGNSLNTPFIRNQQGVWSIRPASSYCIHGAVFFPWLPLLVTEDGRYIAQTFEYIPQWADVSKVDTAFTQDKDIYRVNEGTLREACQGPVLKELAIVYSTIARGNYGHFILDGLSTAYAQHLALAEQSHVILGSQLNDWQKEIVFGLGLKAHIRQALKPIYVERALTSSHTAKHLQYPGRLARTAVDMLRFRYATDDKAPRRVYIRRAPDSRRDIANRLEVEQLLTEYGFTFLDTAGMSVKEQIRMLGRADIVVGQNGAGMMNAFFAPASAEIVDIMPDRYADYWLRVNARQIGLGWNLVSCAVRDEDLTAGKDKNWVGSFDFTYHVPLDELKSALDAIMKRQAALG